MAIAAQTQPESKSSSLKVKISVIKDFPVGWGVLYKAVIEEVVEGNEWNMLDTIDFGITASKKYDFLNVGDVRVITFKNSGEINKMPYLPAINGTVSKKKEIWYISNIERNN